MSNFSFFLLPWGRGNSEKYTPLIRFLLGVQTFLGRERILPTLSLTSPCSAELRSSSLRSFSSPQPYSAPRTQSSNIYNLHQSKKKYLNDAKQIGIRNIQFVSTFDEGCQTSQNQEKFFFHFFKKIDNIFYSEDMNKFFEITVNHS